jgi:arsenate reductase (glutaredoxin)
MAIVQIFGVKNSPATRAAERFFKERRAAIQMVDLKKKAIAAGEIKRFVDRFGWNGLLDTEGKAYVEGGLKYLKLSEAELIGQDEERIETGAFFHFRVLCCCASRWCAAGKLVSIGQDDGESPGRRMLALVTRGKQSTERTP